MNDILALGSEFLEDRDEILVYYLGLFVVVARCTFDEPDEYAY